MAGFALAPANVSEFDVAAALAVHITGYLIGDRNYWAPLLTDALAADGVCMLASFRKASQDPDPARSHYLSRIRYRIETVFSQLVERYQIKQIRARDLWHLYSRLMHKVLSHTVSLHRNNPHGHLLRRLACLVS